MSGVPEHEWCTSACCSARYYHISQMIVASLAGLLSPLVHDCLNAPEKTRQPCESSACISDGNCTQGSACTTRYLHLGCWAPAYIHKLTCSGQTLTVLMQVRSATAVVKRRGGVVPAFSTPRPRYIKIIPCASTIIKSKYMLYF